MSDPKGDGISSLLDSTEEYIQYNVGLIAEVDENILQLVQDVGELKTFVKECTEKYEDDEYMEKLTNVVQDVVFRLKETIEKYIVYKFRQFHRRLADKTFVLSDYWEEVRAIGKECLQVSDKMKQLYQNKTPIAIKEIGSAAGGIVKKRRIHTPVEDNIIGFDEEAEEVKKLLSGDSEKLEVHSIVGLPGVGKTTLARKVFQDHEIEDRFFPRAFISMSKVYDRKQVFLKILSHFEEITDEIIKQHVDSIRNRVTAILDGKRYLIVLDDVWEKAAWDDFNEVFPHNLKQSRVLIITRHPDMARYANPLAYPYSLPFMNGNEAKDLLRWKVFGNTGCPSDLESQIKNYETIILEKCFGVPVSIVVVAGILFDHKDRVDWWNKVSHSFKIFEDDSVIASDIVGDIIGLGFNNLPYYMKPCFLYFGIFPEDFDIPVWKLFRLWISEGFIQGKGNKEDIAERYLEEMVDKNLVMVAESKWNGQIKKCRVHDVVREFCKNEAMKVNFFQEVRGDTPVTEEIENYLRIAINYGVMDFVATKPSSKRVRSFLSFSKEETLLPPQYVPLIPKAFKLLRIFDATTMSFISFPAELFYLILLKYVAMTCNIETISAKLTNLKNLETFIFETTAPTVNVKADIWQMPKFKNLHVTSSATLPPLPVEESTQTNLNLQILSTIAPESCTREVFEKCKNLKKLGIRGNNLAKFVNPTDGPGLFDNLSILESLENLKLLNVDATVPKYYVPDDVKLLNLNANVPLPFLPDHGKFPSNLNRLTLYKTSLDWDHMATLGELNNLMVLKLKERAFVGDIWTVKEGGFHSLSKLHIEKIDLLEWKATSAHFPLLTTLVIKHCNKLTGIPRDFGNIASLQRIDLHWANPKVVQSAKDIKVLKLQNKKSPGFKLGVYNPKS